MSQPVPPIPAGFHSLTPYLIFQDAARAIDFYKAAFGATELFRLEDAAGRIRHVELVIGDSPMMLTSDDPDFPLLRSPQSTGTYGHVHLYVADVDATIARAVAAGAALIMPAEKFGADSDKRGGVQDPFGYVWWIATQVEAITRAELMQRYADAGD